MTSGERFSDGKLQILSENTNWSVKTAIVSNEVLQPIVRPFAGAVRPDNLASQHLRKVS